MILAIVITAADVTDRDGALASFAKIRDNLPLLQVIRADQAYSSVEYTANVPQTYPRPLKIIKREKGSKEFQVLPKRWLVERTFGGLNPFRRLSKAWERQSQTSENFLDVARISVMLRRLA